MTNVSIKLQSTVGDFTPEFMRKLPLVEADMRAHGLEPSKFVISKVATAASPLMSPFFYEYTVFVGDDSFTVTEPNDMSFLEFFRKRCIPKSEDEEGQRLTLHRWSPGLFRRFLRWMSGPI
jgi:hypothetical protein